MSDVESSFASSSSSSVVANAPPDVSTVESNKAYLTQKRKEFLMHMLRSLDIVVYAHLSYLYFME